MKEQTQQGMWRISQANHQWLRNVCKKTGLTGSRVIDELLDRARTDISSALVSALERKKLEEELEKAVNKKLAAEAREQEIRSRLRPGKKADGIKEPV